MATNGKGSQITSKDKYLCSKEGANAQTQRAAQSMQQVMRRTCYAATQKEVRQASHLCTGKRRISAYRRARTKLSLSSFFFLPAPRTAAEVTTGKQVKYEERLPKIKFSDSQFTLYCLPIG